jgi:hypothetical protein
MTEPPREQLLGYLLGALEDGEQADIEHILTNDTKLQRETAVLNRALSPLDASRREFAPPPGLAAQTCAFVTEAQPVETRPVETRPAGHAPMMHPVDASPCRPSRVRWQDSIMAIGIMIAAGGLLFPALQDSREQARLMSCQNNLREIGTSLASYSDNHHGYFPKVPQRGNLAAAGIYAPRLLKDGYLSNIHQVVCPGSALADEKEFSIPTIDELQATSDPGLLDAMHGRMGGSYGYSLGHVKDGVYQHTKNLHRPNFAIMADSPSQTCPTHQSCNHGGKGQNVLFEDGHVKFLPTTRPLGLADDVFTNDDGQVAAGIHPDDSVIGSSPTAPIIHAGSRSR